MLKSNLKEYLTSMQIDQLIFKDNQLYLKDAFQTEYALPNLTTLLNLYQTTSNEDVKHRIYDILNHDLGTLLVVEIMIDATHEVTIKRLETGEISKNMKHVMDYYVILKSHYALAKKEYIDTHTPDDEPFEACHFAIFPYGQVISRSHYMDFKNRYTDTSILKTLLTNTSV